MRVVLAEIWQRRGDEAWKTLAEIHNWLTEGFDTAEPERRQGTAIRTQHRACHIFDSG
jgi:hypothetical protein